MSNNEVDPSIHAIDRLNVDHFAMVKCQRVRPGKCRQSQRHSPIIEFQGHLSRNRFKVANLKSFGAYR